MATKTITVEIGATQKMNADIHLNADDSELQKFGNLAHKWWDKNSEFRPLHEINPVRLNWIDNLI